jgi:hypothetical protein
MKDELELAKDVLKGPIGEFIRQLTGPLAIEIGETFGVWARRYRMAQGLKMLQSAQKMLGDAGINPSTVSPRLFLPILEHASLEDGEEMQGRWAALLANAAAKSWRVHPSFIEILSQLTPQDAQLLDSLCDFCKSQRSRWVTSFWVNATAYAGRGAREAAGESPNVPFQNLIAIGLISADYDMDEGKIDVELTRDGTASLTPPKLGRGYSVTDFAMRFVEACRAPNKEPPSP